jgi:hypothetical protein
MTLIRLILPVFASLALAGCGSGNPLEVTRTSCPAVAVVKYANSYTQFAPGSNFSSRGIEMTAQMGDVSISCKESAGKISVSNISFEMSAARASATTASDVNVPYFVTIIQDGTTILSKQVYGAPLKFTEGALRTEVRQAFSASTPYVPLPAAPDRKKKKQFEEFAEDSRPKSAKYEIMLGFQLTDEQATYNVQR